MSFTLWEFGPKIFSLPSAAISADTSDSRQDTEFLSLPLGSFRQDQIDQRRLRIDTNRCFPNSSESVASGRKRRARENGRSLAPTGHCGRACSSGLRGRRGPCRSKPGSPAGATKQSGRLAIRETWYAGEEEHRHSGGRCPGWLCPVGRLRPRQDEQAPGKKRI